MFYHGHTPADLLKSIIVSIPKDNKASLSKLFDHIISLNYSKRLQSSDMQFGYKEGQQHHVRLFIRK